MQSDVPSTPSGEGARLFLCRRAFLRVLREVEACRREGRPVPEELSREYDRRLAELNHAERGAGASP